MQPERKAGTQAVRQDGTQAGRMIRKQKGRLAGIKKGRVRTMLTPSSPKSAILCQANLRQVGMPDMVMEAS